MSDGLSAILTSTASRRSTSHRRMAYVIRARASRLKYPAIRKELAALAADYDRLAEFEGKPWPRQPQSLI